MENGEGNKVVIVKERTIVCSLNPVKRYLFCAGLISDIFYFSLILVTEPSSL